MLHFSLEVTTFAEKQRQPENNLNICPQTKQGLTLKQSCVVQRPCESHWHTAAHMLAQRLGRGTWKANSNASSFFVTNKFKSPCDKYHCMKNIGIRKIKCCKRMYYIISSYLDKETKQMWSAESAVAKGKMATSLNATTPWGVAINIDKGR